MAGSFSFKILLEKNGQLIIQTRERVSIAAAHSSLFLGHSKDNAKDSQPDNLVVEKNNRPSML